MRDEQKLEYIIYKFNDEKSLKRLPKENMVKIIKICSKAMDFEDECSEKDIDNIIELFWY